MARFSGYKCDVDGCGSFSNNRAGWFPLNRYDDDGVVAFDPNDDSTPIVCSPQCATKFYNQMRQAEKLGAEEAASEAAETLEHDAKVAVIQHRVRDRVRDGNWTIEEHNLKHHYPSMRSNRCEHCIAAYGPNPRDYKGK